MRYETLIPRQYDTLFSGSILYYSRTGTLFVFINRRQTMLRALCYDGSGFWLINKRLSKGRFQDWPRHHQDGVTPVAAKQLKALLVGLPGWQKV